MTEITANAEAPNPPLHPSAILLDLLVTLLAPMFLTPGASDLGLARMAAAETIEAYRARSHADLVAIAQIIAFGLAVLGSLSLSMADDLPLRMVLRLRGNANALNRSAEQNRRALNQTRPIDPEPETWAAPEPDPWPAPEPQAFLSPAAEQLLAAKSAARLLEPEPTPVRTADPSSKPERNRHQEIWATAMMKHANEMNAGIPHLPPAERNAASIRAAMLGSIADNMLTGAPMPPAFQLG